jgi:hypothetical protein
MFSRDGYQWEVGGQKERGKEGVWWVCFVSIYENRRMKPVEIVLRRWERGRWRMTESMKA